MENSATLTVIDAIPTVNLIDVQFKHKEEHLKRIKLLICGGICILRQ